jgi:pentapeptide MXKDX repeat protein
MQRFTRVIASASLVLGLAAVIAGCADSPKSTAKTGTTAGGKMDGDTMTGDKMSGDKMGGDKTTGDKIAK